MNDFEIKIIKEKLGLKLDCEQVSRFKEWEKFFLEYNSHTNLMSRKETANLFEKHIYDSLSIVFWDGFGEFKNGGKLLDIGTGGGFPSVILALGFPALKVFANDSRGKKVKFIELAREGCKISNLKTLYGRAEDFERQNVDIVTFRAVGKIKDLLPLAKTHAREGGYAVFYKAKGVKDEIDEALSVYKKLEQPEIVPYSLPVDIEHTRNLVIFKL